MLAPAALVGVLGGWHLTAGLPYTGYVDEHFVTEAAARQISDGTWDPGWYWYPSLVISLTTAAAWALSVVTGTDLHGPAAETVASPYTELQAPVELIVGGRLVVLAAAVATVVVVAVLGRRVDRPRSGLVAAALVAVLPALPQRAPTVVTDVPATLAATLCVLLSARLPSARSRSVAAALAGGAAGLATASKYTAGAVLLVPLAIAVFGSDRLRTAAAVLVGWAVAAVVAMPALLLRPGAVVDDLRAQSRAYDRFDPSSTTYLEGITSRREVGVLVVALGVAGWVLLGRRRRTRPLVIGTVGWAAVTAVVLAPVAYQPTRNLLPFVPWLCVGAAVAIDALARWAVAAVQARTQGRLARGAAPMTWAVVAALAMVAVAVPAATNARQVHRGRVEVDARVRAVDWLEGHTRPGDTVLVSEELAILPSELDRIEADVEVVPHASVVGPAAHDHVVVGVLGHLPGAWPLVLADRPVLFEVGHGYESCARDARPVPDDHLCPTAAAPRAFLGNDPRIRIFGPRATTG